MVSSLYLVGMSYLCKISDTFEIIQYQRESYHEKEGFLKILGRLLNPLDVSENVKFYGSGSSLLSCELLMTPESSFSRGGGLDTRERR